MKLRNWLDAVYVEHEHFYSDVGTPEVPEYNAQYDKDGNLFLKQTGTRNLYDEIQSYKDSCDLNLIVQRIMSGDQRAIDKLNAVQSFYGDFVTVPKTAIGMLNMLNDAKNEFDKLPADVKKQFDNSFENYIAQLDQYSAVNSNNVTDTSVEKPTSSSDSSETETTT